MRVRVGVALPALAVLALSQPAHSHGIAGNRYFDGTLTFDDPAVADEAILPYYTYQCRFLAQSGHPNASADVRFRKSRAARRWLINSGLFNLRCSLTWTNQVAEAGDQTGAILLRVPQTLKLAIEKSAAVAGVSTNTWLMRCAERAIASEREQKANP
jgi:hypothetical protein